MKLTKLWVLASVITMLAACSSKEDDAKKFGFSSVEEMTRIQALGFESQKDYDDDLATKKAQEDQVAAEKKKEEDLKKQADEERGAEEKKNEDALKSIEMGKKLLLQKVSACGWKSVPESAGFFLGMNYSQVQSFASAKGYELTCKESAPITGGSGTEMLEKMLNDEFSVNRDWRASNLCETKVEGNEISLFFFRVKAGGEPILAKAYNSLNKFKKYSPADTYMAATPVMETLSDKYGFNVDSSNQCSIDSGNGYKSNFSVTFARPYPDRMPNQPNIGLFYTVSDKTLIEIGGAITKARDDSAQATKDQSERNNLKNNASKL